VQNTTKFQDYERFSESEKTGYPPFVMMFISMVSMFLQRHAQYRVKRLMHVSFLFSRLVHYVLQYVAVDVHGVCHLLDQICDSFWIYAVI